jgi:hypothetical protein
MLLSIGLLLAVTVAVLASGVRLTGGSPPPNLGWMSERWLAEYRASHPS